VLHEDWSSDIDLDLARPVSAVSAAVQNLIRVGKETIQSSEDAIFVQDMPVALKRVENASGLLESAAQLMQNGGNEAFCSLQFIFTCMKEVIFSFLFCVF